MVFLPVLSFARRLPLSSCKFSLELWQEMLTDFIHDKSRDPAERWVVMGNSIGGLLTLMLTESLQEKRKARGRDIERFAIFCALFGTRCYMRKHG